MPTPSPQNRVALSIYALAICWLVSSVLFGLYLRDAGGFVAFFLWSVPFFVAGWVLVGIPFIAAGNRILKIPWILLGIAGAIAGFFLILSPFVIGAAIFNGKLDLTKWSWSFKNSLPAFGTGIGAGAVILYKWLLSREINRNKRKIDPN